MYDSIEERVSYLSRFWVMEMTAYDLDSDIISGIHELFTTTAILYDVNENSYSERYCFLSRARAEDELIKWHNRGFNDQRPTGWVACRNVSSESIEVSMKKYHGNDYGQDVYDLSRDLGNGAKIMGSGSELDIASKLKMNVEDVIHQAAYLRYIGKLI